MKLQILADLDRMIHSNPTQPITLKIQSINSDNHVAVAYDGSGHMIAHLLTQNTKLIQKSSPWTNDYRVLEAWLEHEDIQLSPSVPKGMRKAYLPLGELVPMKPILMYNTLTDTVSVYVQLSPEEHFKVLTPGKPVEEVSKTFMEVAVKFSNENVKGAMYVVVQHI